MSLISSISSHVRISYRFYQFVTTRYTTDFFIINNKYKTYIVHIQYKYFHMRITDAKIKIGSIKKLS